MSLVAEVGGDGKHLKKIMKYKNINIHAAINCAPSLANSVFPVRDSLVDLMMKSCKIVAVHEDSLPILLL